MTSGSVSPNSNITISECMFENLRDMSIKADVNTMTVSGSVFRNITQHHISFLSLSSKQNFDMTFLFKNNIVEYIHFPLLYKSKDLIRDLTMESISEDNLLFFVSLESGVSNVEVLNLTLNNSINANFIMDGVSNVTLKDISIYNTSYNDASQDYSMFSINQGQDLVITNIVAQEHQGPMLALNNIEDINMNNCHFTGLTATANRTSQAQSFMNITVDDTLERKDVSIVLDNVNINVPITLS